MKTEIKTYSLMRSGHHAVLMWLAKNFKPNAEVLHVAEQMGGITMKIADGDGPRLVVYENVPLREEFNPSIIVLRDPYNNYASYLKMIENPNFGQFYAFPFLEQWLAYAGEVAGQTDFLKNKVFINYNLWSSSEEYRRQLVKDISKKFDLEMEFSDSQFKRMPSFGGGSSFDKLEHVLSADKMKVLERYKNYEENSLYRTRVDTPEFKKLSEKIFNFYPFKVVERTEQSDMRDFLERFF